jgi:Ca2+-binding RTX toxin-like protein
VLNPDNTFQLSHQYTFVEAKAFRIQTTVTDDDGGTETVRGNKLYVQGTLGGDVIEVKYGSTIAVVNGQTLGTFEDVESVDVLAGPGDDEVRVEAAITVHTRLMGGAGNDLLEGGSGSDVLTGSSGLDWFWFDQAEDHDRATDLRDEVFADDLAWIEA